MDGVIFDIKEGAIHDGPGLRQTVFMKGCPLSCQWCHNPEGLGMKPQLMVSASGCTHCGNCITACPHPAHCVACGTCVKACPQRLRKIVGETLSPTMLIERLMKNAAYYSATGGGTTFSGGEPLMQPEFVLDTLLGLDSSIHTALETSGYAEREIFAAVAKAFDMVMLDLKQMDDRTHRAYTGVSNEKILRNAQWLCCENTPFIIRIPVIPGVNDNDAHYRAVAQLIKGAPALKQVEFLPYHQTAGAKYRMVGKEYKPAFDEKQSVYINQKIFERYGIRSYVL